MEARLAGSKMVLPEVVVFSEAISIVSIDSVADVSHTMVISTIDGGCENMSLGSATGCASLEHLDCNGGPDSLSQES